MVDIRVEVAKGEPIESALRRFKNAVSKSGHLMELRRRKRFESNKEKEIRREKEAARNRRMAKLRSQPPSF
jgi:small subunit ribosomal protein S21